MLQIKALSNHPFLFTMALPPSVPIPLKDFLYKKLSVSKKIRESTSERPEWVSGQRLTAALLDEWNFLKLVYWKNKGK